MAVQLVKTAWSAPSKSTSLEAFHTAYSLSFIHDSRSALLDVVMSRSKVFSTRSQWKSLEGVRLSLMTDGEVSDAAQVSSGAVNHDMLLLTSQFFSHLHAVPGNKSL